MHLFRLIFTIAIVALFSRFVIASTTLVSTLSDTGSNEFSDFGNSVAIYQDSILIGAPGNPSDTGEACIFTLSNSQWTRSTCLDFNSSESASIKQFGYSVALSDSVAIVSAIKQGQGKTGVTFVFAKIDDSWVQEAELSIDESLTNDHFGASVSTNGEYVIVGSQGMGSGHVGSVTVFEKTSGEWIQNNRFVADSSYKSAYFGASVKMADQYLIIGDYQHGKNKQGQAVIYHVEDGVWTQQANFFGGAATRNNEFGRAVSISKTHAVVASPNESSTENKKAKSSGAVYVYQRSQTLWQPQIRLVASDESKHANFGSSVALYKDYLLIGAHGDSQNAGAAYLFKLTDGAWNEVTKITLSDASSQDHFGNAVSLGESSFVIGAYSKNTLLDVDGDAYAFDINPDNSLSLEEQEHIELITLLNETEDSHSSAPIDSDNDGLSDINETTVLMTDPNSADTDNDGLNDHEETIVYQSDPTVADTDSDGVSDFEEAVFYYSDPNSNDTDGDGYSDYEEITNLNTDPTLIDSDMDGFTDEHELTVTDTDPTLADSDGDGLSDNQEIYLFQTDPNIADTDQDGFSDGNEINYYETDPTDSSAAPESVTSSTSFSPSASEDGTLAYEDQWPLKGDYDFNDAVVNYNIEEVKQNGLIKQINFKVLPAARGARYSNSLKLALNVPITNVALASVKTKGVTSDLSLTADGDQTVLVLIDSIDEALPSPEGFQMSNTVTGSNKVTGQLFHVTIAFHYPVDPIQLGAAPYNTFISRQLENGETIEVHFPGFKPTKKASRRQFGSIDDDSESTNDRYYQSKDNLPWAMKMPSKWHHPKERVDLSNGYPDILNWASSKGKSNKNWYKSKRKSQFVFDDVSDL